MSRAFTLIVALHFLLERGLLRDETGVTLSLSDCREEAAMEGSGDEWSVAAAHAARMLPGVFPAEDPVEALVLAPEHAKSLRDHLLKLDAATFQADDSLGWTYQFWRSAEKKAINESGRKIGAAELPAVTQLFTEPYMVRFLLHNTLGAWWAGKVLASRSDLARNAADEDALRAACALPGYAWDYLRFVKDGEIWRPAAGTFSGWPQRAAELTVLDPCCGSGHFLTEALSALTALRAREEGLTPANAVAAVLRDNLAGLEIDGRCVQIASFALALTAWRIGGSQSLPNPNVAWVGAPPPLPKEQFVALANGDAELRRGLAALHDLFVQAPLLGSLIEPVGGDLVDPLRVARIEDSIAALVERMRHAEPERAEGAIAARGMADAAAILATKWVLQATNVPFLGRGRQDDDLANYLGVRFDAAKADLAISMLERMRLLAVPAGTLASLAPQNWLTQTSYADFRDFMRLRNDWHLLARIGEHGFRSDAAAGAFVVMLCISLSHGDAQSDFSFLDAASGKTPDEKAAICAAAPITQCGTIKNFDPQSGAFSPLLSVHGHLQRLSDIASSSHGLGTFDSSRFTLNFWEPAEFGETWQLQQTTPEGTQLFSGCSEVLRWENGRGSLYQMMEQKREAGYTSGKWKAGTGNWGQKGILVSLMRSLPATLYMGYSYDPNAAALIATNERDLTALWAFCEDGALCRAVREVHHAIYVPPHTFHQVQLDLGEWQQIAAEKYPNGLPEPYSDDPTQWLFHGHPRHATTGTELHVALARLSGYRWPAETGPAMRLSTEARARIAEAAALPPPDADGLLALVPVLGERPLADRLRAFSVTAWGDAWTPNTEAALVAATCERTNEKPPRQLTLDAWLRTHAARQHAKLFHERPFLWWITDGRADGFTAVAHYHRLTTGNLERLAYTVLGDWIARLGDDPRAEAARVLQAKLARILEGEDPYDIFVRWKPPHAQPLGWDPDLDDGVRLNIRPFIEAGVLAHVPNGIHYRTDRGKDVSSAPWHHRFNGERRNDHHTTLAEKQAARVEQAVKRSVSA